MLNFIINYLIVYATINRNKLKGQKMEIIDTPRYTPAPDTLDITDLTVHLATFKQAIIDKYAELHAELVTIEGVPKDWIKAIHDEITMDIRKAIETLKNAL